MFGHNLTLRALAIVLLGLITAPAIAAMDIRAVPVVSYQCPQSWGERQYGIPPRDGEKRPRYYFDFADRSVTDIDMDLKELDWIFTNCEAQKKANGLPPPQSRLAK